MQDFSTGVSFLARRKPETECMNHLTVKIRQVMTKTPSKIFSNNKILVVEQVKWLPRSCMLPVVHTLWGRGKGYSLKLPTAN